MPIRPTLTWTLLLALTASVALAQEVPAGIRSVDASGALTAGEGRARRGRPVAVVVHGINPDHGDLDPLTRDLQKRGYTVLRFVYDDSERLHRSAARLRSALATLQRESRPSKLRVVAHSMGGLVSRRALTEDPLPAPPESPEAAEGHNRVPALQGPLTLVTIASPFGGFGSANFSRLDPGIGRSVFKDLGTRAKFIRRPGKLASGVTHVKVETNEAGKHLPSGASDSSVPLKSQTNGAVDAGARLVYRVDRGHVGAVNQSGAIPGEIRGILTKTFSNSLPRKPKPTTESAGMIGALGR